MTNQQNDPVASIKVLIDQSLAAKETAQEVLDQVLEDQATKLHQSRQPDPDYISAMDTINYNMQLAILDQIHIMNIQLGLLLQATTRATTPIPTFPLHRHTASTTDQDTQHTQDTQQ